MFWSRHSQYCFAQTAYSAVSQAGCYGGQARHPFREFRQTVYLAVSEIGNYGGQNRQASLQASLPAQAGFLLDFKFATQLYELQRDNNRSVLVVFLTKLFFCECFSLEEGVRVCRKAFWEGVLRFIPYF